MSGIVQWKRIEGPDHVITSKSQQNKSQWFGRDSNSWPPACEAGVITNYTTEPLELKKLGSRQLPKLPYRELANQNAGFDVEFQSTLLESCRIEYIHAFHDQTSLMIQDKRSFYTCNGLFTPCFSLFSSFLSNDSDSLVHIFTATPVKVE